jgi:hypothetical protein
MKRPEDFGGVFIHQGRVDMRKGINGLAEVVEEAGMGALGLVSRLVEILC